MSKKLNRSSTSGGSLSSGKVPFWKKSKRPILAADIDEIEFVTESEVSSPKNIALTSVKGLLSIVMVVGTLAVAVISILGLTVLPIVDVNGTRWAVKWSAWAQGQAPQDSLLSVNTRGTISREISQRIDFLITPNTTDIRVVVAGPGGEVSTSPTNELLWDGVGTGYQVNEPINPTRLLDNYLTLCLDGVCSSGTYQLTPITGIVGEVLGKFSLPFSIGEAPETIQSGTWVDNVAPAIIVTPEVLTDDATGGAELPSVTEGNADEQNVTPSPSP